MLHSLPVGLRPSVATPEGGNQHATYRHCQQCGVRTFIGPPKSQITRNKAPEEKCDTSQKGDKAKKKSPENSGSLQSGASSSSGKNELVQAVATAVAQSVASVTKELLESSTAMQRDLMIQSCRAQKEMFAQTMMELRNLAETTERRHKENKASP